jgi:cytochrome c-type biogenesis protein CcmH
MAERLPKTPSPQRPRHMMAGLALGLALASGLLLPGGLPLAQAKEAELVAKNPELEARMMSIAVELRCLVCQNQTIADSHAGLAVDLRRQILEMLEKGQSEAQVRDFMTQRYGDFILYRPPVRPSTALLWYGPAALGVIGLAILVGILRRRARMAPDAFDPDQPEDDEQRARS